MPGTPTSPTFVYPRADIALLTITPYSVAEDGTWSTSYSGPVSLLGYIEEVQIMPSQELIREKSLDSAFVNNIPTASDFQITLVEKLRRVAGASAGPVIPKIIGNYSYVKVVMQIGSGVGTTATYTAYGAWNAAPLKTSGDGNMLHAVNITQVDVSYNNSGLVPLSYVES